MKMNVKIPELIHVGGQDIKVEIVDTIEGDKLGQCSVSQGYIKIARSSLGRKQGHSSQLNTFWHEVVHCILDTMGEQELCSNEKFVCCFSSFLCEATKKAYFVEDNDADNEVQGDN